MLPGTEITRIAELVGSPNLAAAAERIEAGNRDAPHPVTDGGELAALGCGEFQIPRSRPAILLRVTVDVPGKPFAVVARRTGGKCTDVALVGELVFSGNAAVAGDKAAGGKSEFGEVVVDDVIGVEAAGEQHAVEVDPLRTGQDDEEALVAVAGEFVGALVAFYWLDLLAGELASGYGYAGGVG